jgi:hypothetical protein
MNVSENTPKRCDHGLYVDECADCEKVWGLCKEIRVLKEERDKARAESDIRDREIAEFKHELFIAGIDLQDSQLRLQRRRETIGMIYSKLSKTRKERDEMRVLLITFRDQLEKVCNYISCYVW